MFVCRICGQGGASYCTEDEDEYAHPSCISVEKDKYERKAKTDGITVELNRTGRTGHQAVRAVHVRSLGRPTVPYDPQGVVRLVRLPIGHKGKPGLRRL